MKLNTAIYAYGTSEGVRKEWDSRGRGRRFSWNPAADGEQAAKKDNHDRATLDEHINEHAKEGNGEAAAAFAMGRSAMNGVKVSRAEATKAYGVLQEHLDDAVKEKNSDLVSALTSAMASLNKFRK